MIGATVKEKIDGETLVREYVTSKDLQIKERAIRAHLPLVKYIVGRINIPDNAVLRKEDLYQYGVIGLLEALERFKPEYGVSFKTFAYKRIHGEIVDALRKEMVLSRDQAKDLSRIVEVTENLKSELGREPYDKEICERAGINEESYHQIKHLAGLHFTLSLDEEIYKDEDGSLRRKDMIVDQNQPSPEALMEKDGIKEELKGAIRSLPERQRLILALYFYEELTLFDIGQVLGITESRVSQILSQTLSELRRKISF